jgi:glucose dehydrogenase
MVWYYQTTPGDTWDYTATQHLILADLVIKGQTRKVIMQAPKNGIFYVLDRTNGKLISAKPTPLSTGQQVLTPPQEDLLKQITGGLSMKMLKYFHPRLGRTIGSRWHTTKKQIWCICRSETC